MWIGEVSLSFIYPSFAVKRNPAEDFGKGQ